MWLKDSSVGRKFVMALSGAALVFFLLFHGCMNLALVFSEEAYNAICRFLGANWYAVIGSLGIAFLILVHFCYGLYLTIQNRAARGNDRYEVRAKKQGVTWESENMLVLGFVILGFLCLHLYNFWFKMQFAELTGIETGAPQSRCGFGDDLYGSEQPEMAETRRSDQHGNGNDCYSAVHDCSVVLSGNGNRDALCRITVTCNE